MNDDYDNAKTDREMLNRLASKDGDDAPTGDSVVAFTFPMAAPAAGELTALAQSAADLLQTRGHGGPFTVTVTVACQPDTAEDANCEPQLADDEPALVVTEAGDIDRDGVRRAECMGTAPHDEHEFNGGMWCPGLTEPDGEST